MAEPGFLSCPDRRRWFHVSDEAAGGSDRGLTDALADVADRDDAAMDLHRFDEPEALAALRRVGSNDQDAEVALSSVGESIAEILLRNGRTWCVGVDELAPGARVEFESRMKPDLTSRNGRACRGPGQQ